MTVEKPLAMLVTVGGATAPAIHTLNQQQPRFICFFVSETSRDSINSTILPALIYRPDHYDWIKTPAHQDLLACYSALAGELPRILEKWGVPAEDLGVEYTAGTKPMSVAAVLATIDNSSKYFYVGTVDPLGRDRGGVGVVLDGKEFTWFQSNPWEELAVVARREIALLFNYGRFADAQERTLQLAKVAPPDMRKVYGALAELIEGYALWDRFDYKLAQQKLYRAQSVLQPYLAGREDPLRATLDVVAEQAELLSKLNGKGEEAERLDVLDMLANAARRADVAKRYDDAVARLYSVLEGLARNRLRRVYDIKTGSVQPEQIPEPMRQSYVHLYSDSTGSGTGLRLGLDAAYGLLVELDDELGRKYIARKNDLSQVLYARNQSRLAHGTEPVRPETYERMRSIVMEFANANETDLPRFPAMNL